MSDICQACGSQITTEDVFCQQCGKRTNNTKNMGDEFINDEITEKSNWQRYRARRRKTMPVRMLIAVVFIAIITLRENGMN